MIKSPCINICKLKDDICQGCFRTPKEISLWSHLFDAEKKVVLEKAKKRKAANTANPSVG